MGMAPLRNATLIESERSLAMSCISPASASTARICSAAKSRARSRAALTHERTDLACETANRGSPRRWRISSVRASSASTGSLIDLLHTSRSHAVVDRFRRHSVPRDEIHDKLIALPLGDEARPRKCCDTYATRRALAVAHRTPGGGRRAAKDALDTNGRRNISLAPVIGQICMVNGHGVFSFQ